MDYIFKKMLQTLTITELSNLLSSEQFEQIFEVVKNLKEEEAKEQEATQEATQEEQQEEQEEQEEEERLWENLNLFYKNNTGDSILSFISDFIDNNYLMRDIIQQIRDDGDFVEYLDCEDVREFLESNSGELDLQEFITADDVISWIRHN